jgi:uncharacterized protein (DUF433 family)
MSLKERINAPSIRDTGISVSAVLESLKMGMTTKQILEKSPHLEDEDIFACVEYASIGKEREKWAQLEYESAQKMLQHYDTLNWQIGSTLMAAVAVLTALTFAKIDLKQFQEFRYTTAFICLGMPAFSFLVLWSWTKWFGRHKSLYDVRNNQVLHRLEFEYGMFHFLAVAERDINEKLNGARLDPERRKHFLQSQERIDAAKQRTNVCNFVPLYPEVKAFSGRPILGGVSGEKLARTLAISIPGAQVMFLGWIWYMCNFKFFVSAH